MLMHHADARADRGAGPAGGQFLTFDANGAFVGGVMAEKDRHERCLACAVFAQKRDDLALVEMQRDIFVRGDMAEPLGDAGEFKDVTRTPCAMATPYML